MVEGRVAPAQLGACSLNSWEALEEAFSEAHPELGIALKNEPEADG